MSLPRRSRERVWVVLWHPPDDDLPGVEVWDTREPCRARVAHLKAAHPGIRVEWLPLFIRDASWLPRREPEGTQT